MLPKDIDLNFLIDVEVGGNLAIASKLHWPKNDASGPTISIGIDLGYLNPASFNKIFGKILTSQQYAVLQRGSVLRELWLDSLSKLISRLF